MGGSVTCVGLSVVFVSVALPPGVGVLLLCPVAVLLLSVQSSRHYVHLFLSARSSSRPITCPPHVLYIVVCYLCKGQTLGDLL